MLCRAELGPIPLKAVTDLKILGFFEHISKQNDDGLLKSAIKTEKGIRKNNKSISLLMKFIGDINAIHEDNFHLLPNRGRKQKFSTCTNTYGEQGLQALLKEINPNLNIESA